MSEGFVYVPVVVTEFRDTSKPSTPTYLAGHLTGWITCGTQSFDILARSHGEPKPADFEKLRDALVGEELVIVRKSSVDDEAIVANTPAAEQCRRTLDQISTEALRVSLARKREIDGLRTHNDTLSARLAEAQAEAHKANEALGLLGVEAAGYGRQLQTAQAELRKVREVAVTASQEAHRLKDKYVSDLAFMRASLEPAVGQLRKANAVLWRVALGAYEGEGGDAEALEADLLEAGYPWPLMRERVAGGGDE